MSRTFIPETPEHPNVTVVQGEIISFLATVYLHPGSLLNATVRVSVPRAPRLRVLYGRVVRMHSSMVSNLTLGSYGKPRDTNSDFVADAMDFEFGNVLNPVGTDNVLEVEVLTAVMGTTLNSRGVQFTVNSQLTYTNTTRKFTLTTDPVGPFTVAEAELALSQTVTSVVSSGSLQQNDLLNYTITIRHTAASNAPVFDLSISDLLDAALDVQTYSVFLSSPGYITGGNLPGNTTVFIRPATFMHTDPPIKVTYQARLNMNTPPSGYVDNEVTFLYNSAPRSLPDYILDVMGYRATSSVAVQTARISGSFDMFSTTLAETVGTDVAVGEIVTFDFVINFPYGTTPNINASVTTTATRGVLEILYGEIWHWQTNFVSENNFQLGSKVLPTTSSGTLTYNNTITFTFGSVAVSRSALYPDTQSMKFRIYTRVADRSENVNGAILRAVPACAYYNGTRSFTILSSSQQWSVEVVVPDISVLKQAIMPASVVMAGDSVQYVVTVAHTSSSAAVAYDLRVLDVLSNQLALKPATLSLSRPDVCSFVNGTGDNDTAVHVLCKPYLPRTGGSLVIKYNVSLTTFVLPNSLVSNTAQLSYSTFPNNETSLRTASSTARVKIATPALSFTVSSSSLLDTIGSSVSVGEVVVFWSKFDLPLGTMPNTTVTVTVPNGLLLLTSAKVEVMPASMSSSTGMVKDKTVPFNDTHTVFEFGTVLNNPHDNVVSSIIVQTTALVLYSNVKGSSFNATSSLKYGNGTEVFVISGYTTLRIIEPLLSMTVAIDWNTPRLEAGAYVDYLVRIYHNGASTAPAYELFFYDVFPPQMQLVPGTVTATSGNCYFSFITIF